MKLKRGDKFEYAGKFWKVTGTGGGLIFAECLWEKVVPAVQAFKVNEQGEIVRA